MYVNGWLRERIMDEPLNWHDLEIFHAVLEQGSFSAAARELGLSQPTVSRHIEQLERTLGKELFTRTSTGLTPSELALDLGHYAGQKVHFLGDFVQFQQPLRVFQIHALDLIRDVIDELQGVVHVADHCDHFLGDCWR